MAAPSPLWRARRTILRAYGPRRVLATWILMRTTLSGAGILTWLVSLTGALIATVGVTAGLNAVAPAHNPTLTWSTGICLALVALFGLSGGAISAATQRSEFHRGATVRAVVTARVFAYRVDDHRAQGTGVTEATSVRRIVGVVALRSASDGRWRLYPEEIFPTRAEWEQLRGRLAAPSVDSAADAAGAPGDAQGAGA